MAVARALYLASAETPGNGRTLIITYNRTLVRYINSLARTTGLPIQVENYHRFARGYLRTQGLFQDNDILKVPSHLVGQAVREVTRESPENEFFRRPSKFFVDEVRWIGRNEVTSLDVYRDINRVGRGNTKLAENLRPYMWEILQTYRRLRQEAGYRYDYDDIASAVTAALAADASPRWYRHIVIDEGQDLSPAMIRSLAAAVDGTGSVSFFGDVAQQIYGRNLSWRSAGLAPRATWEFAENYRNTRSIAELGLAISRMPYYAGEPDMVTPSQPTAEGPKPTLVSFGDEAREIDQVIEWAKERAGTRTVAILLRTNAQLDMLEAKLRGVRKTRLSDELASWGATAGLYYGTYHAAKGLEFDVVYLPRLSTEYMPDLTALEQEGPSAIEGDGRLLYVGVTRARSELVLTYHGEISALLPHDAQLYTRVQR